MSLDRTLLDEHVPGLGMNLCRAVRDRGEHATRDAREEIDTVKRGNTLHETERTLHAGAT
jgi:hypothetical protein